MMMELISATYWLAALFLSIVWGIYPFLIFLLAKGYKYHFFKKNDFPMPTISVVIAAHNESKNLELRVSNVYASDYPDSNIEVVVASDGSSDDTPLVISNIKQKYPRLKLIEISPQGGRSNAHNAAVLQCDGEIIVFTDAETVFEPDFLRNIIGCFQCDDVGFASGVLKYRNQSACAVTESAGFYWKFEYFLREQESLLGVYVFGSGACCAVRRNLYREIPPVGDVDFTTPLDVVLQGKKCVHIEDAIAYDEMPDSPEREFRARIRMTAKNLYGTVQRWGINGVIMYPVYSLVLLFHKIGRWLTPFGMLVFFFLNIGLLSEGFFFVTTFVVQYFFYLLALAGYKGLKVPLARASYSFCLANTGFFVGVLRAITGRVPRLYKPVSQTQR